MVSPYGTSTHYVPNKYTNCVKRLLHRGVRASTERSPATLGDVVLPAAPTAQRAGGGDHKRARSQPARPARFVHGHNHCRAAV